MNDDDFDEIVRVARKHQRAVSGGRFYSGGNYGFPESWWTQQELDALRHKYVVSGAERRAGVRTTTEGDATVTERRDLK